MKDSRIFALYKGEEYIMDGTIREIAKARGCKVQSIKFLLSNAYRLRGERTDINRKKPSKGRLVMVYLEGEYDYGKGRGRRNERYQDRVGRQHLESGNGVLA